VENITSRTPCGV